MKYNFVIIGTVDEFESQDTALDFLNEMMTKR